MIYKAIYADDNFEILMEKNDEEAFREAEIREGEHGQLFNLYQLNTNHEEIRTVI